jgi:hypothetical protein
MIEKLIDVDFRIGAPMLDVEAVAATAAITAAKEFLLRP